MRFSALASILIFATLGLTLQAQSPNASLAGRITDQSKALIFEAKVTAISTETNTQHNATSDTSGAYNLPNLPPGAYRLEVVKPGFKKLIKPDVVLHVQDVLSINFEMQVGSTSETIRVEAGAPLVNSESATVSTLVDNRLVENLPL